MMAYLRNDQWIGVLYRFSGLYNFREGGLVDVIQVFIPSQDNNNNT